MINNYARPNLANSLISRRNIQFSIINSGSTYIGPDKLRYIVRDESVLAVSRMRNDGPHDKQVTERINTEIPDKIALVCRESVYVRDT